MHVRSSDSGYPHLESSRVVENRASVEADGQLAAQLLKRQGWQASTDGTAATVDYFSGTRLIQGRVVFAAVELWDESEGEQAEYSYGVRYHFEPQSCSGITFLGIYVP